MRQAIRQWTLGALALTAVITACSTAPEELQEAKLETSAGRGQVDNEAPPAALSLKRALQIKDLIGLWVAAAAGDDDVYDIPERADNNVEGVLTAFHTVHQTKADSYAVCVDFEDGENKYDVDFFVDQTADGLIVADHYLHQINGETVE